MSNNNEIGALGEDIACRFLGKRGFEIVERNYRKKWGEIDIVARETRGLLFRKRKVTHFIEVKSVTREMSENDVTHETLKYDHRPEDAVHVFKVKRLKRAIQSYLLENEKQKEIEWQFDILAVFLDKNNKKAVVRFTEKLILEEDC